MPARTASVSQRKAYIVFAGIVAAIVFCGWPVPTALSADPQQAVPAEKTDYEFYGSQNPVDPDSNLADLGKLRESLWTHWTERRGGKFRAVAYTYDGDRSTVTFLFESIAESQWCVFVDSRYEEATDPESGRRGGETRHTEEYYFGVRRVDLKTGHAIPDSRKRNGTTYKLLFIDEAQHAKWKY
jgi:hypothetical protein